MQSPAPAPEHRMTAVTWGLLGLLGLIWGASYFFGRVAVAHVPAFTLVFLRVSIAALALHLFLHGRHGLYPALRENALRFLLLGLVNNALPHSLIFLGQTQIGAGLAAILNATTPIWTVIFAHLSTSDERMTPNKIAGTLLGLTGTAVLIGPSAFSRLADGGETIPLWALLLPIGAAMSYGVAAIYGRRFRGLAAPVTATGQLTASTLIMLPVMLVFDDPLALPLPPLGTILAVLALALISTAFGYILFFRIMVRAGATNTTLVTLLVPPSAILFGILFLGEALGLNQIAGMALIFLGLAILDGRLVNAVARRSR
ncbi:DMT family transporter [Rhizobium sp. YIM 134829]|uniref:DMT family transporter n=1 Tax=Rhizobium sp. YIM 134829 TaxID=3390453 RepID=UPI00397DE4C8